MHFFKWLTKSLFALLAIGMMSACSTTPTTESDSGDSTSAAESSATAESKDPKKAKSEALQNADEGLNAIFNDKSGLF